MKWLPIALLLVAAAGDPAGAPGRASDAPARADSGFDHELHEDLFPSCLPCHGPRGESSGPSWPALSSCRSCHDGNVAGTMDWQPPSGPAPTNLKFDHGEHAASAGPLDCAECHAPGSESPMAIVRADANACLSCHEPDTTHLAAENDCAQCHRPLSGSTLDNARVGAFPAPPSHAEEGFAAGGHGAACPAGAVSTNCATCHAQDFCLVCHVDGPEIAAISGMERDERSLAIPAELLAPPDHARDAFLATHGFFAREESANCATCHTAESCEECHVATPSAASGMHRASAERGAGAAISRRAPASHGDDFRFRHSWEANASPQSCAGCHGQEDCLECHLPHAAEMSGGYHPPDFLSRHPAAAWSRETSCADCHDAQSFCAACHDAGGLTSSSGRLGAGFHDGKEAFLLGHGPAARRNLETCVTCHSEPDCLQCHSAQRGRGFSPHGPGFDAERARKANSESCTACHGAAIPR